MDIKKIIKKYEKLQVYTFDNLDETDQFFERHKPPKLSQEYKQII